jgi:trigger factor
MPAATTDLTITTTEAESWNRRLSITVPAERVQRTRTSVASQISRNVRLPGFRKGKLPPRILEQRFGQTIEQETLDRIIQDAYREALETEGLTPITQGKIDKVEYERGTDLTFEVEFEVQPQIELARISGFTATRPSADVGDDEVDAVIERLRDERAEWQPLGEGAKPDFGDQVMVEITARDEDEAEEPRNYRFVLGEGQAIPQVEEAIQTLMPGEEGEFTVHFPEDFPDEARRGEEQRLHITLLEAQKKQLPSVDNEFASSIGDFEDVAALRARILQDLQDDATRRAESEVRGQLLQQIIEANQFDLPNSMVERYLDYVTNHSHADGEGKKHNHSPEEEERISQMRMSLRPQAEWSLKQMMVVERIAEAEGLRATQDEVDARVEEIARKHDRSPSEVWITLEKSGQLETLEREIMEDKVFEHLKSLNTVA